MKEEDRNIHVYSETFLHGETAILAGNLIHAHKLLFYLLEKSKNNNKQILEVPKLPLDIVTDKPC